MDKDLEEFLCYKKTTLPKLLRFHHDSIWPRIQLHWQQGGTRIWKKDLGLFSLLDFVPTSWSCRPSHSHTTSRVKWRYSDIFFFHRKHHSHGIEDKWYIHLIECIGKKYVVLIWLDRRNSFLSSLSRQKGSRTVWDERVGDERRWTCRYRFS